MSFLMAITRSSRQNGTKAVISKIVNSSVNSSTLINATEAKVVKPKAKQRVKKTDVVKIETAKVKGEKKKSVVKKKTSVVKKKEPEEEWRMPKHLIGETFDRSVYYDAFVKGLDHVLEVDPSLSLQLEPGDFARFTQYDLAKDKRTSYFQTLSRGIIGQQLSGKAASAVARKFQLLYNDVKIDEENPSLPLLEDLIFPTPKQVLDTSFDDLRSAGFSRAKVDYVKNLAQAFEDETLSESKIDAMNDDDLVDSLVAIKGIGPWSADMFLLFALRRLDVFSVGDLGVQRGLYFYVKGRPWLQEELKSVDWSQPLDGLHSPGKSKKAVNRKTAKSATAKNAGSSKWKVYDKKEMEYVAHKFKPYRGVFMLFLWKLSNVDLTVLEK